MRTTRKKVIKTVFIDDDDSEAENAVGDFSDSGSEAEIPEQSSSEDEIEADDGSADEFDERITEKIKKLPQAKRNRPKFAKNFISKINKQSSAGTEDDVDVAPALFSVKDLTDEDKLLPSVLNLSESDSSDDETPKVPSKKPTSLPTSSVPAKESDSETEERLEYKDVWSNNLQENSEEIAKKTFMELEQHKTKMEETKASILKYREAHPMEEGTSDIKDLLAQGEEVLPQKLPEKKGKKTRKARGDSDSEIEDWEEVKDAKTIPQQGLQLVVDFPEAGCRKKKTIDIEMMMKRKINRVKKEYQVYMHKVHALCWLGHGNYVSRVLNDQDILAAALSLVPSKDCYPGERVDMKYVEQITSWYKDKLTLKPDKNEDKFRPKAPPLKQILLGQIKNRVVTSKKYLVFIFVSMLRAIGLQCRIMFNFVTLPIKPPSSELCSLSTKTKDEKKAIDKKVTEKSQDNTKAKTSCKKKSKSNIPQVDGTDDGQFDDQNIMQLDGNDDTLLVKTRSTRANKKTNVAISNDEGDDVSPPKRSRKSPSPKAAKPNPKLEVSKKEDTIKISKDDPKRKRVSKVREDECVKETLNTKKGVDKILPKTSRTRQQKSVVEKMEVDNNLEVENSNPRKTRSTNKNPVKPTSSTVKNSKDQILDSSEKVDTKSKQNSHTSVVTAGKDKIEINSKLEAPARNPRKTRPTSNNSDQTKQSTSKTDQKLNVPNIIVTNENNENLASKYFQGEKTTKRLSLNRNRSQTSIPSTSEPKPKSRTKSAPGTGLETSKYFSNIKDEPSVPKRTKSTKLTKKEMAQEDKQRVSHRDLTKSQRKGNIDVTGDLVNIIKKRVREAKEDTKRGKVQGKIKQESDEDSDHLPEEKPKRRNSDSDEDFKPTKISPKASTSRKIDRRVLSSDTDDVPNNTNKCDVWCEVYVEELEQWVAVDVIKAKVHCTNEIYNRASHPVCYVVGWDNNNYLKDLTRRYVPHWNTVTRKQRAEPPWWDKAIGPWLGPKTARDREEDEQLNRMQLEAPLPKSIAEYKNHPLYALKRHLLKFEAIYPPDAATLGFVRGEPVYARDCVHVCRSRDVWLKEARVVRLAEQPYKIVKARPKWDRLSNKLITDKPLEVFGPWQTQAYEPPVAENGVVPRNAYGNVELFKDCMLPKGTVHIKLPGLNRVAKKLNIDCAPAMTGFDFNGGWSHPVYDGFVVCKEFEHLITEAWLKDQEEQERREREKIEARVYGNWRRLIKGLFIRERLKSKYGFEEPAPPPEKKKKGPKLVVKKRS